MILTETVKYGDAYIEKYAQKGTKMKPRKYMRNERESRLYKIWLQMRNRCANPNSKDASKYFNRGISVYNEWNDFKKFESWAHKNGYSDTLTIERNNNDGNYEPSNCSWIPLVEQSLNRRTSIKNRFSVDELSEIAEMYANTKISVNQVAKLIGTNWNTAKSIVSIAS